MGKIKKNGPNKRTRNTVTRIDVAHANTERLTLSMQFFCLDPRLELYNEIVSNNKIQNQQAGFIDAWKSAAVATYGDVWGMLNDDIEKAQKDYNDISYKLVNAKVPTAEMADKLWYIFFATGKVDDLENVWSVSGARMANHDTAKIMADRFITFKDEYSRKAEEAVAKNPKYFSDHPMSPFPEIASKAFAELQKRIDKITEDIEDAGSVDSLIQRVNAIATESKPKVSDTLEHLQENVEDTEEVRNKKEEMKWLVDEFDRIQKSIINKQK